MLSPSTNSNYSADIYDFVEPHTHHLILSPSHFPFNPLPSQSSRASTNFSLSRYPPYILTLLVLTFPPLLFILSSPFFPIRILCLVIGLGPLACTHPLVRPFYPFLGQILEDMAKYIIRMLVRVKRRAIILKPKHWSRWLSKTDTQSDVGIDVKDKVMPLRTILERIMDDDKLSDRCWRAEMREVELWENERFVGTVISFYTRPALTKNPIRRYCERWYNRRVAHTHLHLLRLENTRD